jgi:hypothetical protein
MTQAKQVELQIQSATGCSRATVAKLANRVKQAA